MLSNTKTKMEDYKNLEEALNNAKSSNTKTFVPKIEGYEGPEEENELEFKKDRLKTLINTADTDKALCKGLRHILVNEGTNKGERELYIEKLIGSLAGDFLSIVFYLSITAKYYSNIALLLLAKHYPNDYKWVNDNYNGFCVKTLCFSIIMAIIMLVAGIEDVEKLKKSCLFAKLLFLLLFIAIATFPFLIVTF